MKFPIAGLLAITLAACDGNTTGPLALVTQPAAAMASTTLDNLPLLDALERIAPTLGGGAAAAALRQALAQAVATPSPAALAAVESALVRLEADQPDAAVEADVIRLALAAQQ